MRGKHAAARRLAAAAGAPLLCLPLLAGPAVPAAAPAAAAAPGEPVGGTRLGERGIVVDTTTTGLPALPKIKAASYLIADGGTGEVLAAKDPHGRYLPASTLKALTALTLVAKLDPDRRVRPTQHACDVEGTKVGMTPKMEYRVSDLFHALMMMSANDAAVALAEANGGMRKTLADMNAEARRINALDTLAGSPNGLDVDLGLNVRTQHTSSYDLALILREAMKNAEFRGYVQKLSHPFPAPPTKKQRKKGKKIGGYPIYTHNRMLPGQPFAYQGMLGGKNGYTIAAGQTFVAEAQRGGHTIIIALMKADRPPSRYAAALLDWGFAARGKARPVGVLVPPGDPEAAKKDTGSPGLLPDAPLATDDSTRRWLLVGGGAVGAVLAVTVLTLVLRRRRRYSAPAAPSAPPVPPVPREDTGP
ncbi:D-alanyl-D-alanine carboxypeptidase family protein [Spirillospora albida]|uniref:D-alanyl-D-alanine carboxypeptidase family protein n=1 Tax=Spirillospora albida TaxID=58123 RepID=UPI001FDFBD88|nr:D-alanyl-D-alanine carboxypeptidase [Spirillospora albida]